MSTRLPEGFQPLVSDRHRLALARRAVRHYTAIRAAFPDRLSMPGDVVRVVNRLERYVRRAIDLCA